MPLIHLLFPNPRTKHTSELLINLCGCGKSSCNRDRWDFSTSFLLSPRRSINSHLWPKLGEDSHARKCPPASTSWDEGLGNSESATLWGTTQKLFHQIRHNFITVYTPAATTQFFFWNFKKELNRPRSNCRLFSLQLLRSLFNKKCSLLLLLLFFF